MVLMRMLRCRPNGQNQLRECGKSGPRWVALGICVPVSVKAYKGNIKSQSIHSPLRHLSDGRGGLGQAKWISPALILQEHEGSSSCHMLSQMTLPDWIWMMTSFGKSDMKQFDFRATWSQL
jgi:hypothetical protein